MRTIRRYSNRKLPDTQTSHYVTLAQIAAIIRAGDDIQAAWRNRAAPQPSSRRQ